MMWALCLYYNACGAVEGRRLQKKIACGCLEIQNGNGRRQAGAARPGARKEKERLCYNLDSSPGRYRLGVRTEDSQSSNPGSIPGSATNLSFQLLKQVFP